MLLVLTHEDLARKALVLLGGIKSRVFTRDTVRGFQLAWIVWCLLIMILEHMDFVVCEATKWWINYKGLGMRLFFSRLVGANDL